MRYGSVCSGIEAATAAWHPLGWTPAFFSEIEKFPSAVLAHHYGSNMPGEALATNGVPNLGDMTKFEEWPEYAIDLLVGGTPCQSFSIAGLRKGLDDPRGNLMLTFGAIAQRYRPSWVAWENVPGVLSDNGGRGFASLLGLLSGRRVEVPRDGWRNAGVVPGYEGAYGLAWRVLDAQYIRVDGFGRAVPQRRRRVFVVGYLGDWRRAAAVLLEPESMRGDPPPRREAGQGVAGTISSRPTGGGGLGTDFDLDGGLIPAVAGTLPAAGGTERKHGHGWGQQEYENGYAIAFGGNNTSGPIDVATAVNAHGGPAGRIDFESETFVAHSLRAEGFDASEDGTGRGTPIVPVTARTLTLGAESAGKGGYAGRRQEDDDNLVAVPFDTTQITSRLNRSAPKSGDPCHPLASGAHAPAIAIQERAVSENPNAGPQGAGFSDDGVAYTLEARHHVQAVAYGIGSDAIDRSGEGDGSAARRSGLNITEELQPALKARQNNSVAHGWAVRRLTPTECERLQGFPDKFTNVPWRGKDSAPDGPRYKALGNSMAVNCMRWLGIRIQMVEAIMAEHGGVR